MSTALSNRNANGMKSGEEAEPKCVRSLRPGTGNVVAAEDQAEERWDEVVMKRTARIGGGDVAETEEGDESCGNKGTADKVRGCWLGFGEQRLRLLGRPMERASREGGGNWSACGAQNGARRPEERHGRDGELSGGVVRERP